MTLGIRWLWMTLVLAVVAGETRAQRAAPRLTPLAAPNATLTHEFMNVGSVRELADGRTLIGDDMDKKLLVGDWSKDNTTEIGRIGRGPREFLGVARLYALSADSTLMYDMHNARCLLLRGSGIVGTVPFDTPPFVIGARPLLGADPRGNLIFNRSRAADTVLVGNQGPDSVVLVRLSRATGRTDTVAMLRARAATITVSGPAAKPTSVSVAMNPFVTEEKAALFPDGWIAIGRLDPYRVEWVAPDGKRIRGAPLPFDIVRLDEREIRAYLERVAKRSGQKVRDPASFPPWPEIMPPFQSGASFLPGPDGRLWIPRPRTAANANSIYDVIDRGGVLVARVMAGEDVRVIGFGRGVVYTVMTDDDGIQHLQRRPLPRL